VRRLYQNIIDETTIIAAYAGHSGQPQPAGSVPQIRKVIFVTIVACYKSMKLKKISLTSEARAITIHKIGDLREVP
jgi:hypothetical protein